MEDVLAVYTRPRHPDHPLVCLDESSKQLLAETRVPIPMKPGRPACCDYEYERNGTANFFMMFAPLEGWRHVKVTDRQTSRGLRSGLERIGRSPLRQCQDHRSDPGYPRHPQQGVYEAFPAAEARRLVERFEWHYTPKHGSWLDWRNPKSASCRPSASTAGFPINKPWSRKSPLGSRIAMQTTPRPTGSSLHLPRASSLSTFTLQSD